MPEAINLGYDPRPWQREVHLGLHSKRWGVLVCHRRGGKTVAAVMHMLDRACRLARPNGRYAYIAPQLKQAKSIAWAYLKQYARKIPGTVVSEGELHVTLSNGAQLRVHGADNPDALRGIYLDGVVVDEVAQVSSELWDSVIRPALSDREGWALFLGTPNGVDLLSELYMAARNREDWFAALYAVHQTNALPEAEVAALRRDMTENAFRREFLCDFSAAVDNVLLSFDDVEAASRRHYRTDEYAFAAKIIGGDVARQGDDNSVLIRRQGLVAFPPKVFHGQDLMTLAHALAHEITDWQPDATMVDGTGGYGLGVIDRARQLGYTVIDVQFAAKPNEPRFLNKRVEMWWDMAQWVKTGGFIPNVQQLKLDLCSPTYGFNNAGRMVLESKEDMKKRGLASPDYGDALAVTFAYPVSPAGANRAINQARGGGVATSEYDPMAEMTRR